jgi:hypothetical protein
MFPEKSFTNPEPLLWDFLPSMLLNLEKERARELLIFSSRISMCNNCLEMIHLRDVTPEG